ncbi:MAG: 2-oxo acid dehydrogenase subunit E2 [Gammaproteobacteria bacterium]|nr:2-oxo acid dehydrogenase subunit E2 [Gammaproteobacteria bacterium]
MISEVIIPELGATGGDVTLEEWLVKPGQSVKAGQPLFVVTTDKATVEVEAFREGVMRQILAETGQTLPTGAVVALLADSLDEVIDQPEPEPTQKAAAPATHKETYAAETPPRTENRILVSPLAQRMAAQEGIDLTSLQGSGSHGQILKRDVVSAIADRQEIADREDPVPKRITQGARRELLSPMRRAIAERVQRSNTEIPHFNAAITVDMSTVLEFRQQCVNWAGERGWAKPSITDLCIKAAALTLRVFPSLNASFDGDAILTYADINIGLVIGLAEGMLIPVIRVADDLNLFTLAAATQRLRVQAEAGQLSASDLSKGTFTLSNLGMFGVDSFTAVINPPEAGILALGAVKEQPAVIDGALAARPQMTATLSVDHRVVDGITAARFVESFKEMLENPFRLILDDQQESNR